MRMRIREGMIGRRMIVKEEKMGIEQKKGKEEDRRTEGKKSIV